MERILGGLDEDMNETRNSAWARGSNLAEAPRLWEKLRRSKAINMLLVDQVMAFVIVLNTVAIGLSCDMRLGWGGWIIVDSIFAGFFLLELFAKLLSSGCREYFLGPERRWNVVEAALAVLAVVEVLVTLAETGQKQKGGSSLSLFRIIRLARITRIIRICRLAIFSDLMMMIHGAVGGLRTLLWSMVLISFPVYIVALVLRESVGPSSAKGMGADAFSSLPESFFTVFRCTVVGDCANQDGLPIFVMLTQEYGWGYGVIYCVTILLMTFGLFNVIVAIYVENTMAAAKYNQVHQKQQRLLDQRMLSEKSRELLEHVWEMNQLEEATLSPVVSTSFSGEESSPKRPSSEELIREATEIEISPEFFEKLRKTVRWQEILSDLDVANEDQFDLFETLDVDGGGTIDANELLVGISKLRGDARRSDIVAVSLVVRNVQQAVQTFEATITEQLQSQAEALRTLQACFFPEQFQTRRSGLSIAAVLGS